MSIKDIVQQLPEYSEKMIQRELALLAASGSIEKRGLKRWSRYVYKDKQQIGEQIPLSSTSEESVNEAERF